LIGTRYATDAPYGPSINLYYFTKNIYDCYLELGVDGWIILEWISRRWDVGIWTGLGWPRIETGGGRL